LTAVERKSRRAEYAESTQIAIVEAATVRFAADGFAGSSIDAIADTARVTKGAIYHHFADKSALFEAVFIAIEDQLVETVILGLASIDDPRAQLSNGIDLFLAACCDERFRRIALEDAPVALGWARWKELEESRFLALVIAALRALAGPVGVDARNLELEARMVLAAMGEAGLAVSAADDPDAERQRAGALLLRLVEGLR
jgi:AcrR family transcriptional regulator